MKIRCRFKNGVFHRIPNVKWHPNGVVPEGLYVFKDDINSYIEEFGLSIDDIDIAEAPFQIFRSDYGKHPWLAYGSLAKCVYPDESLDIDYWDF